MWWNNDTKFIEYTYNNKYMKYTHSVYQCSFLWIQRYGSVITCWCCVQNVKFEKKRKQNKKQNVNLRSIYCVFKHLTIIVMQMQKSSWEFRKLILLDNPCQSHTKQQQRQRKIGLRTQNLTTYFFKVILVYMD